MIVSRAQDFFVNGHHCEIEYVRREHYRGLVDGEQIDSSHSVDHLRETLTDDAKWREEVNPDFGDVIRATYDFLEKQQSDGEYLWVYNDTVMNQVNPLDSVGPAYSALLVLEKEGFVEQGDICMERNVEQMWRVDAEAAWAEDMEWIDKQEKGI